MQINQLSRSNMREKKIFGISLNFSNPIEIYRLGWVVLAGTSAIYLFVTVIKAGLGLNERVALVNERIIRNTASVKPAASIRLNRDIRYQNLEAEPQLAENIAALKRSASRNADERARQARTSDRDNRSTDTDADNQDQPDREVQVVAQKANMLTAPPEEQPVRKQPAIRSFPMGKANMQSQQASDVQEGQKERTTRKTSARQEDPKDHSASVQVFTHDLAMQQDTSPVLDTSANRKAEQEVFGVGLAQGKTIQDVRKHWSQLNTKFRHQLGNLDPLIIREGGKDPYPVKLIVGPFTDAADAVKFCSSLDKILNCNLKRYKGTPL